MSLLGPSRDFNIITGQKRHNFPINTTSKRFVSADKHHTRNTYTSNPMKSHQNTYMSSNTITSNHLDSFQFQEPKLPIRRLGIPKDSRNFVFHYNEKNIGIGLSSNTNFQTTSKHQNHNNTKHITNNTSQQQQPSRFLYHQHSQPTVRPSVLDNQPKNHHIYNTTHNPNPNPPHMRPNPITDPRPHSLPASQYHPHASQLSKFVHLARPYAPNAHPQHIGKISSEPFTAFAKKTALCNDVCQLQKNYGTERFFRKFK